MKNLIILILVSVIFSAYSVGDIVSDSHQNQELTCEKTYVTKAYLGYKLNDLLSLRVGCITTHQFGWDQKNYDSSSSISSSFRNNLYSNKYNSYN